MAKSDKLKNLIEALGGEPPRTDSISDCLDALCGCNIGSGGAISWNDLPDKPFGESNARIVLTEQEIVGSENIDGYVYPVIAHGEEIAFDVGDLITVWYDGVEYNLTVKNEPSFRNYVGNGAIANNEYHTIEDTGEPFCMGYQVGRGGSFDYDFYTSTPDNHTVKVAVAEGETKRLDEKFMPLLTSPNGTKWKLTVDDSGTVSAIAV